MNSFDSLRSLRKKLFTELVEVLHFKYKKIERVVFSFDVKVLIGVS